MFGEYFGAFFRNKFRSSSAKIRSADVPPEATLPPLHLWSVNVAH